MSNACSQGDGFDELRRRMVERQLVARGVRDPRVLDAMRSVPRHEFVAPRLRDAAYEDWALPLAYDQTISQPYVVAFMAESARIQPEDRVLEVGSGSGYAAAVLSLLASHVDAVERVPELVAASAERLRRLGYRDVTVHQAGECFGLPNHRPFDAIVVSAAAGSLPVELLDQLAEGGRLIVPVGPYEEGQVMQRITRAGDRYQHEDLGSFSFVPLVRGPAGPQRTNAT